jgi:hypothetical protein
VAIEVLRDVPDSFSEPHIKIDERQLEA